MQTQGMTRRDRGDGSLFTRPSRRGGELWIAKWRADGKQVQRSLGPKRSARFHPRGLTKPEAEAKLRALRDQTKEPGRASPERKTLADVGEAIIRAKKDTGKKPSTIEAYDYMLRVHLVPFFGATAVDKIDRELVQRFADELAAKTKLAPRSRAIALGKLHALIEFAIDEGWVKGENPVKRVRRPAAPNSDSDVHALDAEELEALLRAVPDDALGHVERAMYVTAAMTGARQGELLGLRWQDVDWTAQRIRVRRNFVRGEFGTPKSKRSTRSVPLASRVAAELERLFQGSPYKGDDDLIFAHPETGLPINRSKIGRRYKVALHQAGVREVRFHDLRHTFGTRMASAGVPMRTIQEWMGHRDIGTTMIYADYQPNEREAEWVEEAFAAPTLEFKA
jgi:integrase